MNKVILLGNVGRDPKIRMTESQTVAEFSLATSERRFSRGADGKEVELPELTEWHNIVMWGRAAEFAEKHLRHLPLPQRMRRVYPSGRCRFYVLLRR